MYEHTAYNKTDGKFFGYRRSTEPLPEDHFNDESLHIVEGIYAETTKYVDGNIVENTDFINQVQFEELRLERNKLLAQSDWTQANDSPLADSKKAEWAIYRQQLRDLPSNTSDPANPNWPEKPS